MPPTDPADATSLTLGIVVNGLYAGLSLLVGMFAVKLYRDHRRTWAAVRRLPAPDARDLQLTAHDLELETVRMAKQGLAVVMLWLPLFLRPVLADWPDRPVFEVMRGGVFLFMLGLCFNSYRAVTFNQKFRRRWGRGPRPVGTGGDR